MIPKTAHAIALVLARTAVRGLVNRPSRVKNGMASLAHVDQSAVLDVDVRQVADELVKIEYALQQEWAHYADYMPQAPEPAPAQTQEDDDHADEPAPVPA